MFLSVRSSKLYPRIRWWVSEARTVRPSLRHHRHWTRTPSQESSRFPSRSWSPEGQSVKDTSRSPSQQNSSTSVSTDNSAAQTALKIKEIKEKGWKAGRCQWERLEGCCVSVGLRQQTLGPLLAWTCRRPGLVELRQRWEN